MSTAKITAAVIWFWLAIIGAAAVSVLERVGK